LLPFASHGNVDFYPLAALCFLAFSKIKAKTGALRRRFLLFLRFFFLFAPVEGRIYSVNIA